jgi:hypothetical protein
VSRDVDWSSKASTAATAKAEESFQQSIGRFAPASAAANSSLTSSQQQKPLLLQGFVPATSDQQRAVAGGSTAIGSVEDDVPPLDVEVAKKPPIDLFKSIFEVRETVKLSFCALLVLAYLHCCVYVQ